MEQPKFIKLQDAEHGQERLINVNYILAIDEDIKYRSILLQNGSEYEVIMKVTNKYDEIIEKLEKFATII